MRKARRLLALPLLLSLSATPLVSATLSIEAVEDGLVPAGATVESLAVAAADAFFEAGIIVTGTRPVKAAEASWTSLLPAFGVAREGLVDYILVLFLAWRPVAQVSAGSSPIRATRWRLWASVDGTLLAEGILAPEKLAASTPVERDRALRVLGADIARSILAAPGDLLTGEKR